MDKKSWSRLAGSGSHAQTKRASRLSDLLAGQTLASRWHYSRMSVLPELPPADFAWPFGLYPISITRAGRSFTTNLVPESYATEALAGPCFYVNGDTGIDTNDGKTPATAVKSIWKATQLGNASSQPFNVRVARIAGGYPREIGFSNSSTPVPNTQPAAYIATGASYPSKGGIVDCWTGSTLAWSGTTDATYNTLYHATRSSVSQVVNPTILDENGDPIMATQYPDAVAAQAASGSAWAQVGSELYVKWADGSPVTNANTRALLRATPNFVQGATSKSIYLKGFNFQGGSSGAVACTAAATLNLVAVNCSAGFCGDSTINVNAWKLDYISGLVVLVNCIATRGEADGFNAHWTPGGVPKIFGITIGCVGRSNGRDTVQSCNGLTTHDDIMWIDVNGEYHHNYGANVIPIQACQMWCLGTYAHDSYGDKVHGGASNPTDYQTQFTARMWLVACRSSTSMQSVYASNSSKIVLVEFDQSPGQVQLCDPGSLLLS